MNFIIAKLLRTAASRPPKGVLDWSNLLDWFNEIGLKMSHKSLALLLILCFIACGSAGADNPSDVSLDLSFAGGISTFSPGDPIRLQLAFMAHSSGLSLNVTTTNPPSPVDTVVLTPLSGVFNWMEDRAGGHPYSPDYAALDKLEPGKPVTITLTLNDIYRFDTPGHYRVHVRSARLSGGMQDLGRVLPALTSNELAFEIKSEDPDAEAAKAKELERQIRAAPNQRASQELAVRLSYLPGDAATEAKLSLFLHPKEFYPFGVNVSDGLWIARNRKLVAARLEQALADPDQILDAGTGVFQTAVALAGSAGVPASSIQDRLCHLVAATLPQRTGKSLINAARTVFVTLVQEKQVASPDFKSAREILVTHFDEVDQYNVDWLLNAYGQYLEDLRLNPILLRMLEKPNVSRSAILHYLGAHDSGHVRQIFAFELCAARPAPLTELSDASIETIPEADTCLLDHIRDAAALPDISHGLNAVELQKRLSLAARFASPNIYDALLALYTSGASRWPLQAKGYALAYFNKWHPDAARPLLDAALPLDAQRMDGNITFALFQTGSGVSLLPFLRDRLMEAPPGQAQTAAYYISRYGTMADRDLLRTRLNRWHAQWLGKDIPGDQAVVEADLTSAVANGSNWTASETERDALRDACVTKACQDRFPRTAHNH
jgi:hypothetical protein